MYINDFSMYQCILVCVCVRWCTSIYIYINVCSWVFNGYLNAYSKAYFDESADMCILYIYIYDIVYIHISPHQTLQATGRIFFGPDTRPAPTPLPPARLQFRPTFVVPRCSRSTLWFCLDLRWISDCLSRASRFSTVPPEKTEIFTGSANGHPLTHKMQFNGNTVGKSW